MASDNLINMGQEVLRIERDAIDALIARVDADFEQACRLMQTCKGRVVVSGMGKSGHIGNKIAATLASTGTPSFFLHPGEASHGDLGMITPDDVVIGLSYSGETAELMTLIPLIKRQNVPLIAMSGRPESSLAQASDVHLNIAVAKEACPLNLAPTASSTAMLAMGDALAVALLDARGFTAEDFARSHPGGSLGRRLLVHVKDVMHSGEELPQVQTGAPLAQALLEVSRKGMGMTAVTDEQGHVIGIFTDGDLRRAIDRNADLHSTPVDDVMSPGPKTITADQLAAEAVAVMQAHSITALLVADHDKRLVGALHMHDLLRAGVI
ncbi:MAG: KpsF/GutQ family sugar-phosphate isomerase [Oceanococcus sp.]